ncbi:hypothetical protein pipiens_018592 [Culex pipiens pipiens]|uniref:Uncharacterized protein n=1 Tax=Culex pipiens pipiens TaxID=38569 RepID=A0ABD1CBY6_CULPP
MTPQSNSRTHNNCFSLGKLSNNKSNNRMLHNKIRIWKIVSAVVFLLHEVKDLYYKKLVDRVKEEGDKFPDFRLVNEELYKNCTCVDETGVNPHYANFGRDLLLHTDLYTQQDLNTADDPKVAQDMRLSAIRRIQEFINKRIKKNHEKKQQKYNLRTRTIAFKVGDLVWRRTFNLSSKADKFNQKLSPKFVPAVVREVLGTNLYTLEDVTSGKRGRYHAKDIKED